MNTPASIIASYASHSVVALCEQVFELTKKIVYERPLLTSQALFTPRIMSRFRPRLRDIAPEDEHF